MLLQTETQGEGLVNRLVQSQWAVALAESSTNEQGLWASRLVEQTGIGGGAKSLEDQARISAISKVASSVLVSLSIFTNSLVNLESLEPETALAPAMSCRSLVLRLL